MESKETRPGAWTWISIGVGAGLVVTLIAGLGYHYFESQQRRKDLTGEVDRPFGVVAAIYLREYAREGWLTRAFATQP